MLTFGTSTTVSFDSVDLTGVGSDSADQATVDFTGGTSVDLHTGQPDFNGSADVWQPAGGIALNSGDTISFTSSAVFGLETITFDIVTTAVPEPSTFTSFGIISSLLLIRRRRKRAC
jgi:hypothetical protein